MFGTSDFAKLLIVLGLVIVGVGVLLMVSTKVPWVGRLPGDIIIRRERFTFYFPIVTCIILSILLTLVFSLFRK